ncbi:MAG: B-box zinc finger protein [Acidobacteria bacterium]|nr:B-box zinc finger protein [Acidobacteriota bacterium]
MNCANHPQNPAAAYCRTCGKPLCTSCTRPVMGVIYCETCLAERVGMTPPQPPASPYFEPRPYQPGVFPPAPSAGPNPGLAGLLGSMGIGVGAVYNGQYAKGLAHLGIFVFVIVALSSDLPAGFKAALGIFLGFFWIYQIVDAVSTAKAIQAHQTPPDPFGLEALFSPGGPSPQPAKSDVSASRIPDVSASGIPTGALVLIALGILFLLHNLWFLRVDVLWPLVLIGIGIWLLAKRVESSGGITRSGARGLMGPAVLITLGLQFLLNELGVISFDRTWPLLLIVPGVMLAIERSSPRLPGSQFPPPPPAPPAAPAGPETPATDVAPPSEVKNG